MTAVIDIYQFPKACFVDKVDAMLLANSLNDHFSIMCCILHPGNDKEHVFIVGKDFFAERYDSSGHARIGNNPALELMMMRMCFFVSAGLQDSIFSQIASSFSLLEEIRGIWSSFSLICLFVRGHSPSGDLSAYTRDKKFTPTWRWGL